MMKTIIVDEENHKELWRLKHELQERNINSVITELIGIYNQKKHRN